MLALAACAEDLERPADADLQAASTTTETSETSLAVIDGAPKTATGAGGGGVDERIGPPGHGQPAVEAEELVPGRCFNETLEGVSPPRHVLTVVPCEQPHDAEVFARADLSYEPEAPFPGDATLDREAAALCLTSFEGYVGRSYGTSAFRLSVMRPVSTTWVDGDRTVVCSLHDHGLDPLEGSQAGSGR